MAELGDALEDAEKDENISVIVITGVGDRAFCAEAEIQALSPVTVRDFFLLLYEYTQTYGEH